MSNDSTAKTLIVATLLCVVCSVMVSWAAVSLKPLQDKNKVLDVKKNLLVTAKLISATEKSEKVINEAFSKIETKVVDLATGEFVDVDPASFDSVKAAKDPKANYVIPATEDIAKIKTRAKYEKVYLVKENGETTMLVLPVNGKGLWSTLYGFLVLEPDTTTVKGLGFYQHGETAGLGGEVDNPAWKALWVGKKVFNDMWKPVLKVVKGNAASGAEHDVDGLSGATLTSNGVTGLIQYWTGGNAFGPFLAKWRAGGAN
ncbi:Na(+)-translocating NADH-quinone reductase subunit C [Bacteriovorax sp. Seq25_V]|uniref:Na(+)-translocating NADH-quinone reductase subunit C n=1 Tax=Bacteriovorax sp. Seq25_V TaxID=1201288 RepID=UPI000389F83C|nr:Na(+)-translocating NADH-quinone reductase subunit C [Bacteriovorax sp. Seq25_V]EQC46223.1 NADH:ubiquinone oxidoreductase, Na(+)-translocating, C subunit [Bacteriovorax sp. Seq25_V]